MTATLLLLAAAATSAGPGPGPGRDAPLFRFGGDPGPGLLVNRTPGARPFDRPDPSRPTVVFIHGFNPMPGALRYVMGERLAEAVARRGGPPVNVLEWGWNAASVVSLRMRANQENNVGQGYRLAAALRTAGVVPGRTHLIGQSSGAIVAAAAARALRDLGAPVAQVTLLDAATHYHDVVFDRLAVGTASPRVENYWTDGPGGYGRHAPHPGVWNHRVDLTSTALGALYMPRSAHWDLFRWYLATVEDRAAGVGYNVSVSAGQAR